MDIGDVITKAWQIIWKHKVLWIFGILAGCGSASTSGGSNSGYRFSGGGRVDINPERFFPNLSRNELILIGLGILAVVFVIFLIAVILGTLGRIGLIRGTMQADQGAEKLIFGELFSYSGHYFWRVFLLNLLVGLVFFIAFTAIIVGYIGASIVTLGILAVCLAPCLCLLLPLSWFVSIWIEQANIALVVEDIGIMAGLNRGWEVIKKSLGNILIIALILLLIQIVVGIVIGLPFTVAFAPALIGMFARGGNGSLPGWVISLACIAAYLPFLLIFSGVLRAYTASTWTLTYLRLTAPKAPAVEQPVLSQN